MQEEKKPEKIEDLKEFDNHEFVSYLYDEESGLKGYISIHNMNLGYAIGGTRMYPYKGPEEAIRDVLRVSRTMTYKCALAGLKYGGGKGIIFGDPEKDKTEDLLQAYGRKINFFCGNFITGTDVGINERDLEIMAKETDFVVGLNQGHNKFETPKIAALGVYYAMLGALEFKMDTKSIKGCSVAIKGVGKVGSELVRLLFEAGAKIVVADINPSAIDRITSQFPNIEVVDHQEIHKLNVDIYAPCALSEEFKHDNIHELQAKMIVGSANNQLETNEVGDNLYAMGILYAPDYVVNAGGLINVVDELERYGYSPKRVLRRVQKIRKTLQNILERSRLEKRAPHRIADLIAEEIIYD